MAIKKWAGLTVLPLALATCAHGQVQQSRTTFASYTVRPLTYGGSSVDPIAVNEKGQILGSYSVGNARHGCLIDGDSSRDIGPPVGFSDVIPTALNDRGTVVGYLDRATNQTVPFVWDKGHMSVLQDVSRPLHAHAVDIDNEGTVLVAVLSEGSLKYRMLLYCDQRLVGHSCEAISPDAHLAKGERIVASQRFGLVDMPVECAREREVRLGRIPNGVLAYAHAVNRRGWVVGESQADLESKELSPFVPDTSSLRKPGAIPDHLPYHACIWKDGRILDLGTLPGDTESHGWAIAANGDAVGDSDMAVFVDAPSAPETRAVLWHDGAIADLNRLVAKGSGWNLRKAVGINNNGLIVGTGESKYGHGFVLVPVRH